MFKSENDRNIKIIELIFKLWGELNIYEILDNVKEYQNKNKGDIDILYDSEIKDIMSAFYYFPRYNGLIKDNFVEAYLNKGPTSGNVIGSQYMYGRFMQTTIINSTIGQSRLCLGSIFDTSNTINRNKINKIGKTIGNLPSNFRQLMCYYTSARQQWNDLKSINSLWQDADYESELRNESIYTNINLPDEKNLRYSVFYDNTLDTFNKAKEGSLASSVILTNYVSGQKFVPREKRIKDNMCATSLSGYIDKEYEGIRIYYPGSKNIFLEIYKSKNKICNGKYHLIWYNDSNVLDSLDELELLYDKAVKDKKYIPHFYWAFVITSPLTRGSAFVADLFRGHLLCKNIIQEPGIYSKTFSKAMSTGNFSVLTHFLHSHITDNYNKYILPVKKELPQLDCISLSYSLEDFVEKFDTLFDTYKNPRKAPSPKKSGSVFVGIGSFGFKPKSKKKSSSKSSSNSSNKTSSKRGD